jgi:hypothetical protein
MAESSESGKKPRIIIDEDWKSQVQREKEELAKDPAARASEGVPLPPASFPVLITMLTTQVLLALGQLPNPATGKMEVRRDEARHLIDLIDVIREKTRGNLTADEAAMVEEVLHQLRLSYVGLGNEATATDVS